mmetsp:Transcript_6818/g.8610  ORF Transcript_6818/g.8610 Transcript_6818/m.8610 type:complete len:831 (-) Transcript_6818:338-2830(-)
MTKSNSKTIKRKLGNNDKKYDNYVKHFNTKKQRINWRKISTSIPQFLDADNTVTASKFGARRLPEMKALWKTFLHTNLQEESEKEQKTKCGDTWHYESRGCKVSQRHLRRRTRSHHSKKRHRFPIGDKSSTKETDEIETSASNSRSRKARRKPSTMKQNHSQWKKNMTMNADAEESVNTSSNVERSSSNWLETHIWHAKRFHMSPPLSIFSNWCIPLAHSNRGSRAALRLASTKSTVQDATWTIGGQIIVVKSRSKDELVNLVELICGGKKEQSSLFLLNQKFLSGLEVGYGFIYNLNRSFPKGLIGPGTFQLENGDNHILKVIVDCSIQNVVKTIIRKAASSIHDESDVSGSQLAVATETKALLKIRGTEATKAIAQVMHAKNHKNIDRDIECLDWNVICKNNQAHTVLNHGTMLRINLSLPVSFEERKNDVPVKDENDEIDVKQYVEDAQKKIMVANNTNVNNASVINDGHVMLVSQCPNVIQNKKTMQMNTGVCGWEIFCDPELVGPLFLALNNIGGACSIGIVEAATLAMEAHPPLSLWPRDYPDTTVGMQYWLDDSDEWNLIRYCNEEGLHGGRIKTVMHRLIERCPKTATSSEANIKTEVKHVDNDSIFERWSNTQILWSSLYSESINNNENEPTIVIKGGFVTPFVQALSGWCPEKLRGNKYLCVDEEFETSQRRPRRKIRGENVIVTVPPLERTRFLSQKQMCSALSSSLSISALLRCHIMVKGKGKLRVGMTITCNERKEENKNPLGYVVSGMFSQSRGCCHGVGLVSSKSLLKLLASGENKLCILPKYYVSQGSAVIALMVWLFDRATDPAVGYISILSS